MREDYLFSRQLNSLPRVKLEITISSKEQSDEGRENALGVSPPNGQNGIRKII